MQNRSADTPPAKSGAFSGQRPRIRSNALQTKAGPAGQQVHSWLLWGNPPLSTVFIKSHMNAVHVLRSEITSCCSASLAERPQHVASHHAAACSAQTLASDSDLQLGACE